MSKTQKILLSILTGIAVGFTYFFFGVLDIFAGNRRELMFSFGDFGIYIILIALGVSALIAGVLLLLRGRAFYICFGIFFWIGIMGYAQGVFLNFGAGSLMGDEGSGSVDLWWAILNGAIWVLTGAACVFGAIKMKKKELIRTIAVISLITVLGMQLVSCAFEIGDVVKAPVGDVIISTDAPEDSSAEPDGDVSTASGDAATAPGETEAETDPDDFSKAYLSIDGINEVASGKNVIIFLLDRFDVRYYNDIVEDDEDFFAPLKGFTCFNDNISTYSRTYPAVVNMITGVDTDFECTAEEYFERAYTESPFLNDLKENGYAIKLYTADYYAYRSGTPLVGVADNISKASGYSISDTGALVGNMLKLSAYTHVPAVFKPLVDISSASFNGIVDYNGSAPIYELDDANTCAILNGGLTVDKHHNEYIFIHLNGCHTPVKMDEDCNPVKGGTSKNGAKGCFKAIYNYIEELKRLGVYEDSTIIITGDHPNPVNDDIVPKEPRLTALFVKPAGAADAPLAYSDAQVSQENLIPTIIKSAGIKTGTDYGRSYFDIKPGENTERVHKFELNLSSPTYIQEMIVKGDGRNFDNWSIGKKTEIGYLYK